MSDEQTEIEHAENELRLAMLRSEVLKLEELIDDKLLFIGPDGAVYSKEDDVSLHRSGAQRISRLDIVEQSIQARPDVAAVSVLALMSGVFKGQAFQGRFRYLRVWSKTPGGWRVIAGSVAALTEG